jgi:hypothetical protein
MGEGHNNPFLSHFIQVNNRPSLRANWQSKTNVHRSCEKTIFCTTFYQAVSTKRVLSPFFLLLKIKALSIY